MEVVGRVPRLLKKEARRDVTRIGFSRGDVAEH